MEADLKVTDKSVEIYVKGRRVATHRRFADGIEYRYSTNPQNMPDQFQKPEWDDVRIRKWALKIGPSCAECVARIFAGVKIKEQGYNSSLSLLRLSKKYSEQVQNTPKSDNSQGYIRGASYYGGNGNA